RASQETRPASPTAGEMITLEIKDGGPDGEHSELWQASFRDTWSADGSRWTLVELPFSSFTLRGDYQPGTGDTLDGELTLDEAWGYAITMPPAPTRPWRTVSTTSPCTASRRRAAALPSPRRP